MKKSNRKQVYGRIRADTGQHQRILAVGLLFGVVGFIPIILQLYNLMVRQYDYYADAAWRNQTRRTAVSAARGMIYDRNMNILACSRNVENVYLNPRELKQSGADIEMLSDALGGLLEKDPAWIALQAQDYTKRYKQIAAAVDVETGSLIREYISEKGISGVHLEPGVTRSYPYGSLAAQVIGFTNASNTGSEGIEAAYDSYLEGHSGSVITTKGNNEMDMPFSYENYVAAQEGCDVVLTLDLVVQQCLEKQMEAAIHRYDVQNGAFGIVMDVRTGEVLAMATLGSYDPNSYLTVADEGMAETLERLRLDYLRYPEGSEAHTSKKQEYLSSRNAALLKQWRNRCISDGYEPGSTFKVMTMAAALDCGAIDLETGFYCGGAEQIPGRSQRLHCWKSTGHGSEQTPQALQNSCNIAFAHIALKLGGERFYDYISRFGILEKTGIDLAGESKGVFFDKALVTDTEKWGTASLTSGSFGQTFKLTPLQLVRGIAAVVNGGKLMEPYVVSEVIDADGTTVLKNEPDCIRQVIREETSRTMCTLLESVVTEGTAKNATVAGFSIGGKTGTSEKIDVFDESGQRVQDKIVSFVGVAPMDDPQYIVLVALDTPARSTGIYISGGVMAAPTVGAVMADILPYLEVSRNDAYAGTVVVENLSGMTVQQATARLKEQGLRWEISGEGETVTGQIPAAGNPVAGDGQVLLYLDEVLSQAPVTMPDFTGMTRQQAVDAAGVLGLYVLPVGNPEISPQVTVIEQSVKAGTQIERGTTIQLRFGDTDTRN